MVKNVKGGSGHKSQARKHVMASSRANHKTRLSENEYEIYAQVTALLGNGMCHVKDIDNKEYLCIIRGKFRGRGKRDNMLIRGKWVLIGIREFESGGGDKKMQKCDLLEVYSDADKEKIKSQVKINWNNFSDNDFGSNNDEEPSFEFSNEKESDYEAIIESLNTSNKTNSNIMFSQDSDDDKVDIDDI